MGHHAVERLVGALGERQLHDLHLVELVESVQTADILAVGARLAAEAGGVGGELHGEILPVEDHVAVDVRHGHLGRRHEVEVVGRGVVHLPLLVGQLSRAEARGLVHHHGGLDLAVARRRVVVEEIVDQRALEPGALALVDGESGSGELHAQIEVDDVVLAGQLPVGQRVLGQRRVVLLELHHEVVLGRAALGDDLRGEVGQRHERALQRLLHAVRFGLQPRRALLEVGDEALALLGLLAAALPHQGADLFGGFVLCGERLVELGLNRFAAVVEREDLLDDGGGIDALLRQFADGGLAVVADLLYRQHGLFFSVFGCKITNLAAICYAAAAIFSPAASVRRSPPHGGAFPACFAGPE